MVFVDLNTNSRIIMNPDGNYEYQVMFIDKRTNDELWVSIIESKYVDVCYQEYVSCQLESITDELDELSIVEMHDKLVELILQVESYYTLRKQYISGGFQVEKGENKMSDRKTYDIISEPMKLGALIQERSYIVELAHECDDIKNDFNNHDIDTYQNIYDMLYRIESEIWKVEEKLNSLEVVTVKEDED